MSRRVVITGMGTINPLGKNVNEFWENIKANKNGLSFVDQFDASDFPVKIVGAVKDFDPTEYIDKKDGQVHPVRPVRFKAGSRTGRH